MRIHLRLSGPLSVVIGHVAVDLTLDGDSATLEQALDTLAATYPRARRYLRDTTGALPSGMRVLLNGSRLAEPVTRMTPLPEDAHVTLLAPAVGG